MNIKNILILCVSITLLSCGGGGAGPLVTGITGSGIIGSGTLTPIKTRGSITGFGSIFVNGIEFETDSASVTLDDNTGVQSDLKLGMVVEITGEVDDSGVAGQASIVSFDDDVQGPVTSITVLGDLTQKQLTILNQTVIVDQLSTVFDGVTFDSLATTDLLEISGFFDATGNLIATRVEKKETFVSGTSEIEIKGTVSNLLNNTFTLDTFTVDFSLANLSEVPGGVITSGMSVEVKGTLNGSTINATEVDQEDDFFGDDEDNISIEGTITDFVSADNFFVAGQQVDASSAALSPSTLTLANSIKVEVEGSIIDGVLVAESVEARSGDIELSGNISALGTSSETVTLQFAVGTVTFSIDTKTRMEDDTDIVDIMTFDDLRVGDYLEAKLLDNGSDLVAVEIKRDEDDDDQIQGPADAVSESQLTVTVLGLVYSVDGAVFQNLEEQIISVTEFFSAVSAGTSIKVVDENSDGTAEEVELE